MGRIHGEKIIKRRIDYIEYSDFHRYREILEEDFKNLCGYCGKDSKVLREPFEIDHFVPKKVDLSKKNDYNNLVFSCKKCNRAKWDKWPTNNTNICNDGKKGFVDPASDEYDHHLCRDDDGAIYPLTDVGKYMYEELNFNIRPTNSVWLAMELTSRSEALSVKIKDNPDGENLLKYFKINEELKKLLRLILDGGNS